MAHIMPHEPHMGLILETINTAINEWGNISDKYHLISYHYTFLMVLMGEQLNSFVFWLKLKITTA